MSINPNGTVTDPRPVGLWMIWVEAEDEGNPAHQRWIDLGMEYVFNPSLDPVEEQRYFETTVPAIAREMVEKENIVWIRTNVGEDKGVDYGPLATADGFLVDPSCKCRLLFILADDESDTLPDDEDMDTLLELYEFEFLTAVGGGAFWRWWYVREEMPSSEEIEQLRARLNAHGKLTYFDISLLDPMDAR